MKNILDAYLWGYKDCFAGDVSLTKFKEFYPEGSIHIQIDEGGDIEGYKKIADRFDASLHKNAFKIGYPGDHGDHIMGRECWPKENAVLWCHNLYNACLSSKAKYVIVLEEDTFILRSIDILREEFGISVFDYSSNRLADVFTNFIHEIGGNIDIPLNIFGNRGFGAGGGFIINREQWIDSWEKFQPILEGRYDQIKAIDKGIGWSDCLAQLVIMAGGYSVVMNKRMVQTWYDKRPDLHPGFTHWKDYDIVDYLKDKEEIENLITKQGKFSVIIPTLLRCPNITNKLLESLCDDASVSEILVIDNTESMLSIKELMSNDKIKIHHSGQNLYVNPSWNYGVSLAKEDNIAIVNDDITIPNNLLHTISQANLKDLGVIGAFQGSIQQVQNPNRFNIQKVELMPVSERMWGYGIFMVMHKSTYIKIPEEMKIWCGDDYIFHQNKLFGKQNYLLNCTIQTKMSTTSDDPIFDEIKNNDVLIYESQYKIK
jgi:hypothetical protein